MSRKLEHYFDEPAPSARMLILNGVKQGVYNTVSQVSIRIYKQPLASLFFLSAITMAAVIISNATVHQKHQHPAPLFIMKTTQTKTETVRPDRNGVPLNSIIQAPIPKPQPKQKLEGAAIQRATIEPQTHDTLIFTMQKELADLGYYRGKIDGKWGKQAEAALRAFEILSGLPETGVPTEVLLTKIRGDKQEDVTTASVNLPQASAPSVKQAAAEAPQNVNSPDNIASFTHSEPKIHGVRRVFDTAKPVPQNERPIPELANPWGASLTLAVEQKLAELGYNVGAVDGKFTTATERAIENFEKERSMPISGRINGRLLQEMTVITGSPLL